jgi:TPR repeat protein
VPGLINFFLNMTNHFANSAYRASLCLLGLLLSACQSYAPVVSPEDVRPVEGLYIKHFDANLPIESLKQRADAGDANAQNDLGARFGERDATQAFKYYSLAAEQGLAIAQCNLAFMYARGEGTAKNMDKAVALYSKCAQQGHFMGEYAIGYMHATGEGLPKNGPVAEKWFLLAANQGFLMAQRALVHMYEAGDGVAADPAKAVMWLHRVRDGQLSGRPWKQSP